MNDLSFLFKLSPAERVQLAMDLWDSLPTGDEAMAPLTKDQIEEAERRLAEMNADPSLGSDWAEVRARIRAKAG
jgi:putative addiction module component (TIGR02574 family)